MNSKGCQIWFFQGHLHLYLVIPLLLNLLLMCRCYLFYGAERGKFCCQSFAFYTRSPLVCVSGFSDAMLVQSQLCMPWRPEQSTSCLLLPFRSVHRYTKPLLCMNSLFSALHFNWCFTGRKTPSRLMVHSCKPDVTWSWPMHVSWKNYCSSIEAAWLLILWNTCCLQLS